MKFNNNCLPCLQYFGRQQQERRRKKNWWEWNNHNISQQKMKKNTRQNSSKLQQQQHTCWNESVYGQTYLVKSKCGDTYGMHLYLKGVISCEPLIKIDCRTKNCMCFLFCCCSLLRERNSHNRCSHYHSHTHTQTLIILLNLMSWCWMSEKNGRHCFRSRFLIFLFHWSRIEILVIYSFRLIEHLIECSFYDIFFSFEILFWWLGRDV